MHRIQVLLLLGTLLAATACTNKKVSNPIANVDSKQPDKVLFDRAMDAMKHNHYDVARITLQTMINTYPDSEYIARAKLAEADSWYDEGGTAALAQAETDYNDFITFFPNMPEAAEAQLKIANIHYQQMEKPDRDYTNAMRAEEEYRKLILQFPDSKLVPEAKLKLLQVEEVLAEKEFEVGHFYYLRQSYPAAIARLQTLVDRYPLYSKADEALFLLGQSYEGEAGNLRARPTCTSLTPPKPFGCVAEGPKAAMMQDFTAHAAQAYDRILTRYPLMSRAGDAKARLIALKQPVPRPTKAAVAENRAEENSRKELSTLAKATHLLDRHPDVSEAVTVGEPTLVDPEPVSATAVVQQTRAAGLSGAGSDKDHAIAIEALGNGAPPAGGAVPHSDDTPAAAPAEATAADNPAPPTAQPDANELKPDSAPDPNELKPNTAADNTAATPPQQVNELNTTAQSTSSSSSQAGASTSSDSELADDSAIASSKPKKKKGIHKVVPF